MRPLRDFTKVGRMALKAETAKVSRMQVMQMKPWIIVVITKIRVKMKE
jgi:hypothetical protein